MKLHHLVFVAACFVLPATDAWAQPKNSAGDPCIKSGSERHVGKGSDGKKYDCMMDYCTTCGVTSGQIDCQKLVTEWSNATDCKPVADIHANQSLINRDLFNKSMSFESGTPNQGADTGAGPATGGTKGTVDGGAGGAGGAGGFDRGSVMGNLAGATMSGGGPTIL